MTKSKFTLDNFGKMVYTKSVRKQNKSVLTVRLSLNGQYVSNRNGYMRIV